MASISLWCKLFCILFVIITIWWDVRGRSVVEIHPMVGDRDPDSVAGVSEHEANERCRYHVCVKDEVRSGVGEG